MGVHHNRRTKRKVSGSGKRRTRKVGGGKHNGQVGGVIIKNKTIIINELVNKKVLKNAIIESLRIANSQEYKFKNMIVCIYDGEAIVESQNIENIENIDNIDNIDNISLNFDGLLTDNINITSNNIYFIIKYTKNLNHKITLNKNKYYIEILSNNLVSTSNSTLRSAQLQTEHSVHTQTSQTKKQKTQPTRNSSSSKSQLCKGLEEQNIALQKQLSEAKNTIAILEYRVSECKPKSKPRMPPNAGPILRKRTGKVNTTN
jgi:hypothetical protein